jgi:predicted type IV restriction endonuclease
MLKRLRTLFGKGDKLASNEIPFEDLPSYIEREEDTIRRHLENEVATRLPQIVSAIETLQQILDSLSNIERTPSSHPKLEKIAQSSLPHFVRSFQQHINRPLPDDADEFYHEVSLLLKGCITTMRGAGKYLPAVFPEEMKALRHEIGIIGRKMNELTTIFSQAKEEKQRLSSLRVQWNAIRSLLSEQEDRKASIGKIRIQMSSLQEERARIERSLEDLQKSDAFKILVQEQAQLTRSEEEVRNLKLQKEQGLGVVISVYRRAARIARHQNNREREKMMEESINLLESSPRECEQIRKYLSETLPSLMELIQTGTLSLKGQDEQRIFSSGEVASGEVYHACMEIRASADMLEEKKKRIREMPAHADLLHLKGEEGRISHSYERLLEEQEEQETALQSLPERIRMLIAELKQQVPDAFKGGCSLMFTQRKEPDG